VTVLISMSFHLKLYAGLNLQTTGENNTEITSPVVSVSVQIWFIRYIYHRKLQILDNVITIKLRSISFRHKRS